MTVDISFGEPLSQVVFVHDYVQLVFQEATLSAFNEVDLEIADRRLQRAQHGYCDELVALLGQKARRVDAPSGFVLALQFSNGTRMMVRSTGSGPEAFHYQCNDTIVVEQNAA